jgi:hypothetical protein
MESPEQFHSPSIEFIKSIKPEIRQYENNYIYICYIALYEFAAHYCCRKRVLDAACGLGFGSYFLTQAKKRTYISCSLMPQVLVFEITHLM